jgi:hypothetical protein
MEAFIADFRALREARREERLEVMEAFLSAFEETHRRIWRTQVDFNLFSMLGVRTDELCHSSVLAWLLDAESGHGQGALFMQALADLCGLNLPAKALERYSVRTEFSGEESIIDVIVFRRGRFLVYLENKVLAPEGPSQVDREFRDMRRYGASLAVPLERQWAIFLTPRGRSPISGDPSRWAAISYRDVGAAFEQLLPSVTSNDVRLVLEHWIDAVSNFGGARYDVAV